MLIITKSKLKKIMAKHPELNITEIAQMLATNWRYDRTDYNSIINLLNEIKRESK